MNRLGNCPNCQNTQNDEVFAIHKKMRSILRLKPRRDTVSQKRKLLKSGSTLTIEYESVQVN